MRKKFIIGCVLLAGCPACDSGVPTTIEPDTLKTPATPLTPEEMALNGLTKENSSAIAFSIHPSSKYVCNKISVQLSRKIHGEDYWKPYHTFSPVFDVQNPATRTPINEQIQYAVLDKPGSYAVTEIRCDPFKGEPVIWDGVIGDFKAEYGKLNYIGDLVQHRINTKAYIYTVEDRSAKLKQNLIENHTDLASFFHVNPLVEGSFTNFDGQEMTYRQVIDNVGSSGDYFALYTELLQTAEYLYEASRNINVDVLNSRWYSISEARQYIANVNLLYDYTTETVYKFEDLVTKDYPFESVKGYIELRQNLDKSRANFTSCNISYNPHPDSGCSYATLSLRGANDAMEEYLAITPIDVGDSDAEKKIKQDRQELVDIYEVLHTEFREYVQKLSNMSKSDRSEQARTLNIARIKAADDLNRFDANRLISRYSPDPDTEKVYLEALEETLVAREKYLVLYGESLIDANFSEQTKLSTLKEDYEISLEVIDLISSEFF